MQTLPWRVAVLVAAPYGVVYGAVYVAYANSASAIFSLMGAIEMIRENLPG
jgi:hypothetical protein